MNIYLSIAAVLSVGIALLHTFMGGRHIAAPLLAANMASTPKYTSYFCWHIVTLTLAGMAVLFGYAAFTPTAVQAGWTAVVLAGSIAALGIVMVPVMKLSYRNHPQGWLFVPVAAIGFWGCLS